MRLAPALISLLALAACGSGETNVAAPVASSTPAANGQAWVDMVVRTPEGGYRQGNPDAPIKLVEYGSRNCPACGRFAAEGVEPLRAKYIATGRVSYEFRDFLIHGAPDLAAALLNQCVPTEAFFATLDQLFANQQQFDERLRASNPQLLQQFQTLPPAQAAAGFAGAIGYIDFMKQQGVPEARAQACLSDQKAIESISKVNADAANSGIGRTPTFMINGRVLANAGSWAELEPELQIAGAR